MYAQESLKYRRCTAWNCGMLCALTHLKPFRFSFRLKNDLVDYANCSILTHSLIEKSTANFSYNNLHLCWLFLVSRCACFCLIKTVNRRNAQNVIKANMKNEQQRWIKSGMNNKTRYKCCCGTEIYSQRAGIKEWDWHFKHEHNWFALRKCAMYCKLWVFYGCSKVQLHKF